MPAKKSTASKSSIANDSGSVSFPCPKCTEVEIVRSKSERQNVVKYTCEKCGFSGPN
jgi:predicted RNA-binding Zn-ribbon protein involved in translation (DUF1610 family)